MDQPPHTLMIRLCNELWISSESSDPITILPEMDPEDIVITAIHPPDTEMLELESPPDEEMLLTSGGVHFLSDDMEPEESLVESNLDESNSSSSFEQMLQQTRRDLLEYLLQENGTVVCKWCGEVLPSRTHWYRHKYKQHTTSPPGTNHLYKCKFCNVFFKSRKGYMGHISSRHNETINQPAPAETSEHTVQSGSADSDCINATTSTTTGGKVRRSSSTSSSSPATSGGVSKCVEEYNKRRENEEKLVAEIIDRVRKECEAQGSTEGRRGYTRRTTVMNT